VTFVTGGDSRQASVRAALATIQERAGVAVVHDAARPFAAPDLFSRVLDVVDDGADAAIPVVSVTDTVVRVRAGVMAGTEPREELALAQTPQAFRTAVLREAHAKAEASGFTFTDDASVLEWAGFEVRTVPGDPANVKITTLAELAEADRRMGGEGG
jgi:2-C-methyl-D-erythritol 4-phosphate cytidylyltransferase